MKAETPLLIKSTFLGAHAVPLEYKGRQTEYVDLIINEMIPMVAAEELADYIDVFCDKGFFTVEDTDRMLNAGMKYGLRAKIHANELDYSGGVQVGVKYNAISVRPPGMYGRRRNRLFIGKRNYADRIARSRFFPEYALFSRS